MQPHQLAVFGRQLCGQCLDLNGDRCCSAFWTERGCRSYGWRCCCCVPATRDAAALLIVETLPPPICALEPVADE